MGAGFDFTHAYALPLAVFFLAMVVAGWLMTRLGPYRYVATPPQEELATITIEAESLG
jgi:hypothetical protein